MNQHNKTQKSREEFEKEFLDNISYMTGESEEDVKDYRRYEASRNSITK